MKVFIINSFRLMVYVAYFAIIALVIAYCYMTADLNKEMLAAEYGLSEGASLGLGVLLGVVIGWIAASVVCGLIMTVLDIRDDINDRLPDARDD